MSGHVPVKLAFNVYEPRNNTHAADIIMIHGLTSCKEVWIDVAQDISDQTGRKVYTLDLKNHGDSPWSDVHDVKDMAKDLSFFMDDHKINSAIIIGHSLGGRIAMRLALTEPQKLDALIIEDVTPKILSDGERKVPLMYIKLLMRSLENIPPNLDITEARKIVSNFMHTLTPKEYASTKSRQIELLAIPLTIRDGKLAWKANLKLFEEHYSIPQFTVPYEGVFEKPTFFIYGTRSTYCVDKEEKLIKSFFPNAKLKGIEDATHLVHYEYPKEFTEAVVDFINKL